jgi:phosphoribosylanthranilate isomerase
MSLWIKICGNTSLADAQLAVDAGADAVGFVFAPSPRHVTSSQAVSITSQLPSSIEKIGVFVDASLDEICSTVGECRLTGVQLHFNAPVDLPRQLREQLGPAIKILRVMHFESSKSESIAQMVLEHARNPHVDAMLVDSRTATAAGGTGVAFDWTEARRTVFRDAAVLKLIAAGGLNPSNVAEAIATLQPWGVDVVSGVEAAPGRKDPLKTREFVLKARKAAKSNDR